jgi:hypothetical protein
MAQANLVKKKVRMGHRDIIKYQLVTYCFTNQIQLSSNELSCLALLGAYGECELAEFCNSTVEEKIFKTSQTVRNFLTKACKLKLVKKDGSNKKRISLSPKLQVQTTGNIVLDFKLFYIVTKEQ